MSSFGTILPPLVRPTSVALQGKWLGGQGAGAWFVLSSEQGGLIRVKRYTPSGLLDSDGVFKHAAGPDLCLKTDFEIAYLSHCLEVNVMQKEERITFRLLEAIDISQD